MLTYEQIKELIELVGDKGLQGVTLERSGFRLHIEGQAAPLTFAAPAPAMMPSGAPVPHALGAAEPPATQAATAQAQDAAETDALPEDAHVLTSPIVGTYYSAPSPDSEPYVKVGDTVAKGQVLCIVEAMKLMNEIECDADGEVLKILPKNAQPVEFGEPLFVIRTS